MKVVGKAAAFLVIGVFLFGLLETVLVEKDSYSLYRAWKAADDVDVLVLGNSHAENGIRAGTLSGDLSEHTGRELTVFNYAVFGMRMEQMYFFAKEIFKTQVPDLVILETYAFCPLAEEHREILARRAFDVFPLSWNKIEAVQYCVNEDYSSYYVPFIKYHSRWESLKTYDIQLLYDSSLWPENGGNGCYVEETMENPGDGWFRQAIPAPEEVREITPSEKECLEKLLSLLEEKNVKLLFVSVPYKGQMGLNSIEQIKINNYLRENYVNGDNVRMLDMNVLWEELDFDYDDLYNEGHVNKKGADKVTERLLEYLKENDALLQ